ncbi:MAG TPA: hypothetical protein VGG39_30895 [Polyangiaceae bacterium]|jgi:hypothetical protein
MNVRAFQWKHMHFIASGALALGVAVSILTVQRPAAASADELSADYVLVTGAYEIQFSGCGFSSLYDVDVYFSTESATDCQSKTHHIGTYEAFLACCGGCSGAFSGTYSVGCPSDTSYWVCAYNDHTGLWSNTVSLGPVPSCIQ